MITPSRILLPYGLLALAGCGDALAPEDVSGIYALTSIQGQVPPVVVRDDPSCRYTVVDGTLTLASDQSFELRLDEMVVCPDSSPQGQIWLGSWALEGDAVVLRPIPIGEASDAAVDLRLTRRNGTFVVPLGGVFGDVVFFRPTGTGRVAVHTRTTGADLDPDGYAIRVDDGAPLDIGVNDSLVIADVPAGRHEVGLEGLASNCSVEAITSPVSVEAGATFDVNIDITCVARTGYLQIRAFTQGGDPNGDEFTVQVDSLRRSVPRNGALALLVPPGDHDVLLATPAECMVEEPNPRQVTVAADDAVHVTFVVTCPDGS